MKLTLMSMINTMKNKKGGDFYEKNSDEEMCCDE